MFCCFFAEKGLLCSCVPTRTTLMVDLCNLFSIAAEECYYMASVQRSIDYWTNVLIGHSGTLNEYKSNYRNSALHAMFSDYDAELAIYYYEMYHNDLDRSKMAAADLKRSEINYEIAHDRYRLAGYIFILLFDFCIYRMKTDSP